MKTVPGWIAKVIGTLLVVVLVGLTADMVLSQTIMSSKYLDIQLKKADAYHKLSVAITDELVHNTTSMDPAFSTKVQSIVTPEVLEQRIPGALSQLEEYMKNGGTAPQIDVSDLVAQARAAGVDIPADSNLDKPVTLGPTENNRIEPPSKAMRTLATVAAVVLGAALVLVCWLRRDFRPSAGVVILYGVVFVIGALLLWFVPDILASRIHFAAANAFASVGQDVATAISKDIAKRFGVIGGIALAAGVVARIILALVQKKQIAAPAGKAGIQSGGLPAQNARNKRY